MCFINNISTNFDINLGELAFFKERCYKFNVWSVSNNDL
jgi:hypothetical protein